MFLQKVKHHRSFLKTSCYKVFSSQFQDVQLKESKDNNEISKKCTRKKVVNVEIINYMKECGLEHLIDEIPKALITQNCKQRSRLYIINPEVAKSFATLISEDLLQNTSHVIETNPGLGLLTKELLKIGVPAINLYEKNESFLSPESPLGLMLDSHKSQLNFKRLDFVDIWFFLLFDKYNDDKFSEAFLADTPYSSWRSRTFAQIIVYAPSRFSLTLLVHNFFNFTEIFEHGRPCFFIAVPSFIWARLYSDDKSKKRYYSQFSVMLHLFFDQKVFGELPRRAFLPWPSAKTNEKTTELLAEPMLVLKIEPKVGVLNIIKKQDLKPFWHFLKYCMKSQKIKVIMEFEKFVPGCGPKLIKEGIDICSKFKDLTPKQLLDLFKLYKSWPEYDENAFCPTVISENKREDDKTEDDEEHLFETGVIIDENKKIV